MITFDFSDIDELKNDLEVYASRAYPQIIGKTLNKAAITTRAVAQRTISTTFINRNRWTAGSIRFSVARGFNPNTQQSSVGSMADYMRDQELGWIKTASSSGGVDIPTRAASGEGRGGSPRTKPVRAQMRMSRIILNHRRVIGASRRQRIVAAVKMAARAGGRNRFVYLPFDRHPGIYRVTGGMKRQKITEVHDFGKKTVVIRPRPWLLPSAVRVAKQMDRMFISAAHNVLKRYGILGH